MITYRQNVDKLAEQQQSKYLDLYTILPSEISMQLAEVSLALGAIEDQVLYNLKYIKITYACSTREHRQYCSKFSHVAFVDISYYVPGAFKRERNSENQRN